MSAFIALTNAFSVARMKWLLWTNPTHTKAKKAENKTKMNTAECAKTS